jgi:hypothetical protein
MSNYEHIYAYRKHRRGGGISLFVRNTLTVKTRTELCLMTETIESLFIEIPRDNTGLAKDVIIGIVYRPPNQDVNLFNEKLCDTLARVKDENKLIYLMGDFNINILETKNHLPSSEFLDMIYTNSLFPLITKPTRMTTTSATLIDNIFTNDIANTRTLNGIFFTDISDHLPIFAIVNTNRSTDTIHKIQARVVNKKNMEMFCNKLSNANWDPIVQNDNGKEAFNLFYQYYAKLYDECFPYKTITSNYSNRKPWLSEGLKKSIKVKNQLYVKQLKTRNMTDTINYKRYRNYLSKLLSITERNHYNELLKQNKQNTRKLWSIIKEVINKKKNYSSPSEFKISGKLESKKDVIANAFNCYFNNIGKELAQKIPNTEISPLSLIQRNPRSIAIEPVDTQEVIRIVSALKNASAGCDGVHSKVVKETLHFYLTPLTHVLNLSLTQGFFPDSMKISKIVPLYKSGDPMVISNYRPVAILPLFSKLLERMMYNRLMSFVNMNKILYKYQFGFRQNHSTALAITILVNHLLSAMDNGDIVVGTFLDFRKAFDTVDHSILLGKLEKYGIRGLALEWIKDYLLNRQQYVSFNNVDSNYLLIKCGVPQGSILGPLLFILYINDIMYISKSLVPIIFADDTNIFLKGKNVHDIIQRLNSDMGYIFSWLNTNKLSLNTEKTHFMIFKSRNRQLGAMSPLLINGKEISQVVSTKFLGVILDSKLSWEGHIKHIKSKVARGIGILCKARKSLDKTTLVTLYYSMVYPHITYCIEAWGRAVQTHFSSLFKLQKKILRIITSSAHRTESNPLFSQLKILKLSQLYIFAIAIFMFKLDKGFMPNVFDCMFSKQYERSRRTVRNSHKYDIPFCKTELYKKSIVVDGPKIWNKLEDSMEHKCSLHTFKKKLKKKMLEESNFLEIL